MSKWLEDEQKRKEWGSYVRRLNPDIDPVSVQLMDEFRYVWRTIYHRNEKSLADAGISSAQYRILMQLFFNEEMRGNNELNPSEISERQGVSRNTISSLLSHLEEDGLVDRCLDTADRRRFKISLTAAGRHVVSLHARAHFETISQCFDGLNASERETLLQILSQVRSRISSAGQTASQAANTELCESG